MLNNFFFWNVLKKCQYRNSSGNVLSANYLYKLQIQDFIIEKIVSLQVESLPDLLQSSSIIGSAIQETETVSVKSLVSKINVEGG